MNYGKRIEIIRERCLARKMTFGTWWKWSQVMDAASLKSSEHMESWQTRRGILCRDRLKACRFEIDKHEILAGRILRPEHTTQEIAKAEEYLKQCPPLPGISGHCEMYLTELFALGISGLESKINSEMKLAKNQEEKDVLQSFLWALDGFSEMIKNAAEAAEKALAEEQQAYRKKELEEIAASCRRIAISKPETFMDALHLLWFVDMGIMEGDRAVLVVPGHIDRTLISYYQEDIAAGRIDEEKALFMIECLYVLINEYVPDGLAMSVMVGGRYENGNDITNELSFLCLEALRRTKLVYPTTGICWHEKTPEKLTELCIDLISKGYTTPAFFGDGTIQQGLKRYGVPDDEACYYVNSTCVEITPAGSSNIWVASPYFSTCKVLLEEIEDEVSGNKVPASFDGFMGNYFQRLDMHISEAAAQQNSFREQRKAYGGKPLQSIFTRGCIEKHKDIDNGGAKYNWVENSFVGLANLSDSLYVIKKEVFEKREMSLAQLKEIIDSDFKGEENTRMHFLNSYPKYGNNDQEVDAIVKNVVNRVIKECGKYKMLPDESPFVPGAFCFTRHEVLGRECGATPDGRHAGTPFADGGGPAQGREKNGPTAAVLSTTSWDHSPLIGGIAFNMKFDKSLFETENTINALKELVLTYLRKGGFEVQINVVDQEVLKKAKKNPEGYRDLVVRIGGYTDYFTRLSPEMQDEVISRTGYTSC